MARKTVNTREYKTSHGHAPRGRGGWLFAPAGERDNEAAWVNVHGTYTEACKALPAGEWVVLP